MVRTVCVALSVAFGFIGSAHGASLWKERLGKWAVEAQSDDQTGAFSACGGGQKFDGGNVLVFVLGKAGWTMGVNNSNWQLAKSSRYDVRYWIDAYEPENASGVAISSDSIELPIRDISAFYQNVRDGYRMFVYSGGTRQEFEIAGAAQLLSYIDRCVKAGGRKPSA